MRFFDVFLHRANAYSYREWRPTKAKDEKRTTFIHEWSSVFFKLKETSKWSHLRPVVVKAMHWLPLLGNEKGNLKGGVEFWGKHTKQQCWALGGTIESWKLWKPSTILAPFPTWYTKATSLFGLRSPFRTSSKKEKDFDLWLTFFEA